MSPEEALHQINKVGEEVYQREYIPYHKGVIYREEKLSVIIQELVDEQLADSGMSLDEFYNDDLVMYLFGMSGIAHAMTPDGEWLDIDSITAMSQDCPDHFYIIALDDGYSEEKGTPLTTGGDNGTYFSTLYHIINDRPI